MHLPLVRELTRLRSQISAGWLPPTPAQRVPPRRGDEADVAFFVPTMGVGGAERVFASLANEMAARGLRVEYILLQAEGSLLETRHPGIEVRGLGSTSDLGGLLPLVRELRTRPPRVLISGLNVSNLLALWARPLGAPLRTRLVLTQHTHLTRDVANSPSPRAKQFLPLAESFFPLADQIIAVSTGVAEDLAETLRLDPQKLHVAHNPIPIDEIIAQAAESVDDRPDLARRAPIRVVSVGRLHPQKDYLTLFDAFEQLLERGLDADLLILGEGPHREEHEARANTGLLKGRVLLPGFVDNPHRFVARSDVFVMSSAWEGFGNVLVESMAAGTPVVSTDCESGPAEILEGGEHGPLVPVGDAKSLADAIEATLAAPKPAGQLLARARHFDPARVVDRYLELIGLDAPGRGAA